ncbi:methylated-DNA--[protein]-cysteine S-methyltransferase [Archaeoglobus profundus]|uniref:Methylated-DNA--protein-cysteine methyltransferase n=1 Tax=Archaeoglobus profundus (strain DSM 5631 / JCM 9629 / NBRC 100127 / Av18) TaxID=572546 RepID=D2REC8_ARCPA|nr:methylated-DNA--[protein]-cysteine S-methyltransferase [Archaeoglobus profundus]ADB58472.1 methylated-DNA/protein-cysteinemethyltransferase [Archaeoglobus profundus DSM 5631]
MIESLSVEWKVFVNVYIENGKVFKVEFSKNPVEEKFVSTTAKMLKKDLEKYFSGRRVDFRKYDVDLRVSSFVKSVLEIVKNIPYGKVVTYGYLARILKTSPRAIGIALKLNPVPVIIPCHRVVAKDGLGGFSAGVWIKRELLKLEGATFLSQQL